MVDVEEGRENCRKYVEERQLIRVAKESGLTTDQVVEGVATGELVVERSDREGYAEHVGVQGSGKGHFD